MAKIENDAEKTTEKAPARRRFAVEVSFDGLGRGETFVQDGDDGGWADRHVATGYLRDLGEETPDGQRGGNDKS